MSFMQKITLHALLLAVAGMLYIPTASRADEFSFTFEWGDFPRCTTGYPRTVDNPIFTLSNVPAGTVEIYFKIWALDFPSYNHGGGTVPYSGGDVIGPGAFKYKSPCPPGGRHRYRWKATAKNGDGDAIAEAKTVKKYPE